ncbi:MAG TPA: DUF4097 family beta strand repeat-containing protein [Pyrinomonadaceae bacterium]|nr:DUF4097 family beta strand repeat-containing protein [Pyrinomonadaceae bacterium]
MGRRIGNIFKFGLSLCLAGGIITSASAQVEKHKIPKPPKVKVEAPETPEPAEKPYPRPTPDRLPRDERFTSEKAMPVESNVYVKLCVSEGTLKITGSERNEVRVFVRDGRKFVTKVLEKNPDTGKPIGVWIANATSTEGRPGPMSECLAGQSVEIDVPMNASINLSGRATGATLDSVKKVSVKIVEGSIVLRNISGGISAVALQGDVMVESSAGAIAVETTTGNVLAFDVSPGQVGDLFKARTNSGTISLQKVNHRQIEANSISGSVNFNGKFLMGGIYTFKTTNGSIRMLLPQDTSCNVKASYGFGTFNSALPMKVIYETVSPGGKNLSATIGAGEATVNLTTSSGSIGIRKQN